MLSSLRIIHYPHELVKLLSAVTACAECPEAECSVTSAFETQKGFGADVLEHPTLRAQHVSGEAFRMYTDRHSLSSEEAVLVDYDILYLFTSVFPPLMVGAMHLHHALSPSLPGLEQR